jgi:hypothetical protein
MVASRKMAVFCAVVPPANTFETLVNFYQTTWRCSPEDSDLKYERALFAYIVNKIRNIEKLFRCYKVKVAFKVLITLQEHLCPKPPFTD